MDKNTMDLLLSVFTSEQLLQFAKLSKRLQERAKERGCYQTMTIPFNAKGYPTHFSGTDNEKAVVPKNYKAE